MIEEKKGSRKKINARLFTVLISFQPSLGILTDSLLFLVTFLTIPFFPLTSTYLLPSHPNICPAIGYWVPYILPFKNHEHQIHNSSSARY